MPALYPAAPVALVQPAVQPFAIKRNGTPLQGGSRGSSAYGSPAVSPRGRRVHWMWWAPLCLALLAVASIGGMSQTGARFFGTARHFDPEARSAKTQRFRELMAELQRLTADEDLGAPGLNEGSSERGGPAKKVHHAPDDRIQRATAKLLALASTPQPGGNASHDDAGSEESDGPAPEQHTVVPPANNAAVLSTEAAPNAPGSPSAGSDVGGAVAPLSAAPAPAGAPPAPPPAQPPPPPPSPVHQVSGAQRSSHAILAELRAARLRGQSPSLRRNYQPPVAPPPPAISSSWAGFITQQRPQTVQQPAWSRNSAPAGVNAWGGDAATVALVHSGSGTSPPTLADIRNARSDLLQLQLQPVRVPTGGGPPAAGIAPGGSSPTPAPLPTSVFDAPAVDPPPPEGVDGVSGESLALHAPRSDDDAAARAHWFYNCINVGQRPHLPKGRPPAQVMRDKATLRRHAFQIHYALRHLRNRPVMSWANYTGPWIENQWISEFAKPVRRLMDGGEYRRMEATAQIVGFRAVETPQRNAATVLVEEPFDFELFYPWVPLFINWEDIYMQSKFSPHIANTLGAELARYILPNVQYITVTQRFQGLFISNSYFFKPFFANILNLAAGGNGHVVLPLLARPRLNTHDAAAAAQVPPSDYPLAISFAGEQKHGDVRKLMLPAARTSPAGQAKRFQDGKFATDAEWLGLMEKTAFQLAPRGVGPTSFRLYEVLQMGWVPVVVTDDTVWLPYRAHNEPSSIWNEIAHVVHIRDFSNWVNNVLPSLEADAGKYRRMRLAVAEARDKYFTFEAVLRHIRRLIDVPQASQLRCVPKLT